ncbi:N-acetylglucosamine-6-phosphate deacetylase [Halieaceae bacterium]|nr:N-acetylglucosamine-6-phosphate deacetylase [Halieaceae bacterium]
MSNSSKAIAPEGRTVTEAITAPRIFDGDSWLFEYALLIEDGQILDVLPTANVPPGVALLDLEDGILAPGFIDLQVNGGGGVMFNSQPEYAGLQTMLAAHRGFGTTAIMPTLISDQPEIYQRGIAAVREARDQGNPSILGLHIEGPFFEPTRRGAHRQSCLRDLTEEDIGWLCAAADLPLMLTLAPERCQPGQISQLAQAGILVCAGHTSASFEQARAALQEGLRGFTHLYNAMGPVTAREPGVVGAALDDVHSWAGIIADGHHVHPASLLLAHRAKARGKLCLVTDAMATVGTSENSFQLYDETITLRDGKLVNAEGKLAGSAIGMIQAVRVAHEAAGIELGECLNMASRYPAAFLRRDDERGCLAPGYRVDLTHFDDDYRVHNTWIAGDRTRHDPARLAGT